MKKITTVLISIIYTCCLYSQISEGGTPPSFEYTSLLRSSGFDFNIYQVPVNFDVEELIKEEEAVKEIAAPPRIAVEIPVDIDINRTGEWLALPNGERIWQQVIHAPGADGLILYYEDFYIPEGAKLFIYNEEKSHILGAYTRRTKPERGVFSTEIILGDKITLEYVASETSNEEPALAISNVGYGYGFRIGYGDADDCLIDIICEEGDNWRDQQRGVVSLYFRKNGGYFVCTGALVNNTKQDGTPYILSANHCFNGTSTDYSTMQVYFNYENEECNKNTGDKKNTLVGTELLVDIPLSGYSDGVLLLLKDEIPEEYNVYYNGWDATGDIFTSGVVIHHPMGDAKKISTFTTPISNLTWTFDYVRGATNAHWNVYYAPTQNGHSVTEGGSSGSPLFSNEGLIIGTLSGGSSYCRNNKNGGPYSPDYFGKFWYHWDQAASTRMQLKGYLDPLNSGVVKLEGYQPQPIDNSVVIERSEKLDFVIFPNPVEAELNINAADLIISVQVYDMTGKLMAEVKNNVSSTLTLPVMDWSKGVYNIVVKTKDKQLTSKFIKN